MPPPNDSASTEDGTNGKPTQGLPERLQKFRWQPGQTGNPKGGSAKSRLRAELEKSFARNIMVKDDNGVPEALPFSEYVARYLLKWAFPQRPDPKLLPFHVKCLQSVLERMDPVTAERLAPIVQVVVHTERQENFWNEIIDSVGDRRVTPVDVIEQLRASNQDDNGKPE